MSDLESRLRAELRSDSHALPGWPDPAERVAKARSRQRQRHALFATAAAVVIAAVAVPLALSLNGHATSTPGATPPVSATATGPSPAPSATGPQALPWVNTPGVPQQPSDTRPPTTPCTATDLGKPTAIDAGGAMGHTGYRVHVVNVGHRRCTLTGVTTLSGVDTTTGKSFTLASGDSTYFDYGAAEKPPTLDPGEYAQLTIVASSGCNGGAGMHAYRFDTLSFAGRHDALGHLGASSSCPIQLGPWSRPLTEPEQRSPLADLTATIQAPVAVDRGTDLHYIVTLTNPTDHTVDFGGCPSYIQTMSKSGGFFQLNCAVTRLAAGASQSYQMVLPVPDIPEVHAGPAGLAWALDGNSAPSAVATITIQAR